MSFRIKFCSGWGQGGGPGEAVPSKKAKKECVYARPTTALRWAGGFCKSNALNESSFKLKDD